MEKYDYFKSPLQEWVFKNHFFMKKEGQGNLLPATHLLLNGGRYHIPNTSRDIFHTKYARDIQNGWKHFICEQRTDIFKMFADLDFLEEKKIDDSEVIDIVKTLQKVINEIFISQVKKENLNVVISTTDVKSTIKHGNPYVKTGIHLIWTDLYVNQEIALIIRRLFIQALENKYDERKLEYEPWSDVVDKVVYTRNGMRMIGSRKCHPCVCKDYKVGCDICQSGRIFGKIDEGRAYIPAYLLDVNGNLLEDELETMNTNFGQMIKKTSIVSYSTKPNVKLDETNLPEWYDKSKDLEIIKKIKNLDIDIKETKNKTTKTEFSKEFIKKLHKFIITKFPNDGKKFTITKIEQAEDKMAYWLSTDCTYCLNVNRCHNSSTVWFRITNGFIFQHCFSKKLCKNYRSPGIKLPPKFNNELFQPNNVIDVETKDINEMLDMEFSKEKYNVYLTKLIDYYENKINDLNNNIHGVEF